MDPGPLSGDSVQMSQLAENIKDAQNKQALLKSGVKSSNLVLFYFVFKEPQNKPNFSGLLRGIYRSFQESTI